MVDGAAQKPDFHRLLLWISAAPQYQILPFDLSPPLILSQALLVFSAGLWSRQRAMQISKLENALQFFKILSNF